MGRRHAKCPVLVAIVSTSELSLRKKVRFWNSIIILMSLLAPLGGCALLPADGPASMEIRSGIEYPDSVPYAYVKITPQVAHVVAGAAPRLTQFKDRRRPGDIRFGVGDILAITIYEAASGGLFIPAEAGVRPGNFITLPNQAVDNNGNVSIPYAGNIRARGRTKVELQDAIVEALKNRAIEPQVVVSMATQLTSLINVLGEVRIAGRLPATVQGERILDIITRAGGPNGPGPDKWVMLDRGGQRALAPFGALFYEPANNVYVFPNDTVYVYNDPQTFLVFGALGTQQQIPFGIWRLSLAEAVAKAGGLNDSRADPASVFLYRGETREVAEAIGIDCTRFAGPIIPVIYNINFRDPAAYFLASNFEMRNKDVIFVSNAASVEAAKLEQYIQTITSTVNDPVQTAISIYTLKSLVKGTGTAIITGGTTTTTPPPPPPPGP
jgi:polysaccharide export outer membrane protein